MSASGIAHFHTGRSSGVKATPARWDRYVRAWGDLGFGLALEMTSRERRAGRNW